MTPREASMGRWINAACLSTTGHAMLDSTCSMAQEERQSKSTPRSSAVAAAFCHRLSSDHKLSLLQLLASSPSRLNSQQRR